MNATAKPAVVQNVPHPPDGDALRVVVDANVVAAALIRPDGWTASELRRREIEWFAPRLLIQELEEHADEFSAKAGCPRGEWKRRIRAVLRNILWVETDDLIKADRSEIVRKAKRVDPDDAPYMAALVAVGAEVLWTRDTALLDAFPGLCISVVPPLENE